MRGSDERTGELFSYVDLEKRIPGKHPLRPVRRVVNEVLAALDGDFSRAYAEGGRPSIAPERLLRALLLQAFYTIRSERQLMEQIDYNLLYPNTLATGPARCSNTPDKTHTIVRQHEFQQPARACSVPSESEHAPDSFVCACFLSANGRPLRRRMRRAQFAT